MAKTITQTVAKSTARTATVEKKRGDNFKRAKECLAAIGENTFDFSVAVADIYVNEEYATKYGEGRDGFTKCAQEEWGMSYRSAMNHVTVGSTIRKFEITKERASGIGWTNFMEISSLFTEEMKKSEIDGMIKKASKMTHDEVQRYKQEVRHKKVGGSTETRVKLTFQFLNEQADVILEGLKVAKELMGVEHDDTALEYIVVDWLSAHDESKVDEIKAQLKGETDDEGEAAEEDPKPKAQRKQRADVSKKNGKKAKAETAVEDDDEEEAPAPKRKAVKADEDDDLDIDDLDDEDEDEDEDDSDDLGI